MQSHMYVYICIYAETEEGIAQAIVYGQLDFKRDPWPKVSEDAKKLVKGMLDHNPQTRLTVEQVLGTYVYIPRDNLRDTIHIQFTYMYR